MTLEIRLLGPPTFTLSGQPLQLVRRKSIALLAWLAVTRRPQSREAITGLIWPEFDHESSLMNLRRDLSWLRKTLGDGFVAADRLQIAIEPDAPLWLDVQIFDSALSAVQKHNHPPTSLCPDCVANLSQAIELYQGDFMAGFSLADSNEFEEWQFFQREEQRRAAGSAFEKLCAWHGSQAEYEQGIAAGRRWLGLDPWHEPAHRALMRLYAQADQQAAALRQYETCRRVLDEKMGVQPEAETTALYEAIRSRQTRALYPRPAPRPSMSHPIQLSRPRLLCCLCPPPLLSGAPRR
jgi:DNA-binding SARP family transcriptional activator